MKKILFWSILPTSVLGTIIVTSQLWKPKKTVSAKEVLMSNKVKMNLLLSNLVNKPITSVTTSSKIKATITDYQGTGATDHEKEVDFKNQAKIFFKDALTTMFKSRLPEIKTFLKTKITLKDLLSWINFEKIEIIKKATANQPDDFGINKHKKKPYTFWLTKIPLKESNNDSLEFQFIQYIHANKLTSYIAETMNNMGKGILSSRSIKEESVNKNVIISNQVQLSALRTKAKDYLNKLKNNPTTNPAVVAAQGKYNDQLEKLADVVSEQIINKQKEIVEINNYFSLEYNNTTINNISKFKLEAIKGNIKPLVLKALKAIPLKGFANYGDWTSPDLKKTWEKNDAYILDISKFLTNDTAVYKWKFIDFSNEETNGELVWKSKQNQKNAIKFLLVQSDDQQIEDIKSSFLALKPLSGFINDNPSESEILAKVFDRLKKILNNLQNKYDKNTKKIIFTFRSKKKNNVAKSDLNIDLNTNKADWVAKMLNENKTLSQQTPLDKLFWFSHSANQADDYFNLKIFIKKITSGAGSDKELLIKIPTNNSIAKFKIDSKLKILLNNLSSINNLFDKQIQYKKATTRGQNNRAIIRKTIRNLVNAEIKALLKKTNFSSALIIISNNLQVKITDQINYNQIIVEISFTYNAIKRVLYNGYVNVNGQ